MALVLKRITNPYECVRCHITRKIISYGEEYYEDDDDGLIVDFNYYYDLKLAKRREEAMPAVQQAMDRFGYQQALIQKQREFLNKTMFDRPLAGEDCTNWDDYHKQSLHINNHLDDVPNSDNKNNNMPTDYQGNSQDKVGD